MFGCDYLRGTGCRCESTSFNMLALSLKATIMEVRIISFSCKKHEASCCSVVDDNLASASPKVALH